MKTKPNSQGNTSSSESPTKASPKKSPARRTAIKLRATTEKCVAKRTRDKSPKQSKKAFASKKTSFSFASGVKSGGNKNLNSTKSKSLPNKNMEGVSKCSKKAAGDKKSGIVKAKYLKRDKKSTKTKAKQSETKQFIDLWAFVNLGKREASLNASLKVNILYERPAPVKSVKISPKKSEVGEGAVNKDLDEERQSNDKLEKSSPKKKKSKESPDKKNSTKGKAGDKNSPKKGKDGSNKKTGKLKPGCPRKRKSPAYKIFKEEPPSKCRKLEKSKSPSKNANKVSKKSKKSVPSGHQLSNIIEKSPRQASLFAKAMIAMEQEEEAVQESAARTRIFEWMELRPYVQNEPRRIGWINGLQKSSKEKDAKTGDEPLDFEKNDESALTDVDVGGQIEGDGKAQESESLHNTLLRTLHQIGDSRLLKEYLRAQKEDLKGSVDVEKCATPEKQKLTSPEPKKIISALPMEEKQEKSTDKPASCSPAKPQPCRVATPIPQFPVGQRTSHMTSYIHHPIAQPIYPQQHHHAHPQPIKVTPYAPSPAYIYQYAVDRPQSGLYASPSPSPISFGVGNNEISPRDYSSTFTLNHMGTLSLGRRGVNPYQPAAYNPSMHLPMQQIGFNFPAYFPASIQALPQQNMAPIQPLPLHQQYPIVQQPVITQNQIPQDVGQLGSYQSSYSQYPSMTNMSQNTNCMPPPPPPPAHSHRPTPMGPPAPSPMRSSSINQQTLTTVSPIESLRSMNPVGVQSITRSPALDFSASSDHCHGNPHRQTSMPSTTNPPPSSAREFVNKGTCSSPTKYTVNFTAQNNTFSPCKKEHEEVEHHCDVLNKSAQCNNEFQPRSSGAFRAASEGSDVSDLLHSAHTTMYQIDGMNSMENIREFHQAQASVSCNSTVGNSSPPKISIIGHASFNASYSVSSILDMPSHKVKSEPSHKSYGVMQSADVKGGVDKKLFEQSLSKNTSVVCFTASAGSSNGSGEKDSSNSPSKNVPQKSEEADKSSSSNYSAVQNKLEAACSRRKEVIIIEDTDESSDDEPLAKLVKVKSADNLDCSSVEIHSAGQKKSETVPKTKTAVPRPPQEKSGLKAVRQSDIIKNAIAKKLKAVTKKVSQNDKKAKQSDSLKTKKSAYSKPLSVAKRVVLKPQHDNTSGGKPSLPHDPAKDDFKKSQEGKDAKGKGPSKKTALSGNTKTKKPPKKVKAQPQWPQTPPRVNTNHGWAWIGEAQMKPVPKLTIGREEPVRIRKCYNSMQHSSGERVSLRDCVILQSDGDGSAPYVAKVSALWENLNGEMMFSMLWYYQPEHTATGREPEDGEQELFASKHREENSVACIDDKCYVLMYNEYCRLEAEAARLDQGIPLPRWREQIPGVSEEDRKLCHPPPPANACVDNIWFCRYDYDIRKKMVKKPKHKKSNLRYRAPFIMA